MLGHAIKIQLGTFRFGANLPNVSESFQEFLELIATSMEISDDIKGPWL
jgi:hypothetical protein